MSKIKKLRVLVTVDSVDGFEACLRDIEANDAQIQQLRNAALHSSVISGASAHYPLAAQWLNENIEDDEDDREYQIISIETPEQ